LATDVELSVRPRLTPAETGRVIAIDRVIHDIFVEVQPAARTAGVFANESSRTRIEVSGAVVIKAGLGIRLAGGELERVGERSCGCDPIPERVVGVSVGECASRVAERRNGT
jgi:hypothetical protein